MGPCPFSRRAFTLIELMVVLAIVGTLLTVALPSWRSLQDRATGELGPRRATEVGLSPARVLAALSTVCDVVCPAIGGVGNTRGCYKKRQEERQEERKKGAIVVRLICGFPSMGMTSQNEITVPRWQAPRNADYGHLSASLDFAGSDAPTIRAVTRAATVNGEYPHPLAYL